MVAHPWPKTRMMAGMLVVRAWLRVAVRHKRSRLEGQMEG